MIQPVAKIVSAYAYPATESYSPEKNESYTGAVYAYVVVEFN